MPTIRENSTDDDTMKGTFAKVALSRDPQAERATARAASAGHLMRYVSWQPPQHLLERRAEGFLTVSRCRGGRGGGLDDHLGLRLEVVRVGADGGRRLGVVSHRRFSDSRSGRPRSVRREKSE